MSNIHEFKDMLVPFFIFTFLITWGIGVDGAVRGAGEYMM